MDWLITNCIDAGEWYLKDVDYCESIECFANVLKDRIDWCINGGEGQLDSFGLSESEIIKHENTWNPAKDERKLKEVIKFLLSDSHGQLSKIKDKLNKNFAKNHTEEK